MALPVALALRAPIRAYRRLRRDLGFSPVAAAHLLYDINQATGIIGWPELRLALQSIPDILGRRAKEIDSAALDEMIRIARARVPQDTGRLFNGITGDVEVDGERRIYVFRASAVRTGFDGSQGADYARFVEFGTRAGARGSKIAGPSRVGLISEGGQVDELRVPGRTVGRARRQYRNHPGTDPQPFFYPAVNEVMARRAAQYHALPAQIAREAGL